MRVIAGKHRSRPLAEFKGRDIRPTADRAKEALFNILQNRISGCVFLDLYAGTGGIGIEAISRGAKKVVFVDMAKESVMLIKRNLEYLKEQAEVIKSDALSFVKTSRETFDIIFLDPPYAIDASEVLSEIGKSGILSKGGVIIYERCEKTPFNAAGLTLKDSRRYGVAVFDFYTLEN